MIFFLQFLKQYKKSFLFSLFILIISIVPVNSEAARGLFSFPYMDKFVHFIFYAVLCFLLLLEIKEEKNFKRIFIAVLICFLLGGSIEIIQSALPRRTGDIFDIVANFSGSLASIPFFNFFKTKL